MDVKITCNVSFLIGIENKDIPINFVMMIMMKVMMLRIMMLVRIAVIIIIIIKRKS